MKIKSCRLIKKGFLKLFLLLCNAESKFRGNGIELLKTAYPKTSNIEKHFQEKAFTHIYIYIYITSIADLVESTLFLTYKA